MVFINMSIKSDFDDDVSEQISKEVLNKTMLMTRNEAIKLSPVDNGELQSKIVLDEINPYEYEIVSLAKYSESMEYGTVPFWAPIAPLKEWASRKLGDENIGYAIQKKIAKEGISAHPFMRPALDIGLRVHLPIIVTQTRAKYK